MNVYKKVSTFVILLLLVTSIPVSASAQSVDLNFTNTFLNGQLTEDISETLSGLIYQSLGSTYPNIDSFDVNAQTTILSENGNVYLCNVEATLRSLVSKDAQYIRIRARYDIARMTWVIKANNADFIPSISDELTDVDPSWNPQEVEEGKKLVEQDLANAYDTQDVKSATSAKALVSAPISSEDARAGWAGKRIAGKFRAGGWATDMYLAGNSKEPVAWDYIKNGSSLLSWYSNSHGVTSSYNGAPANGLVYESGWSGLTWYDGNLMHSEFSGLGSYTGLVYNVVYIDACNSYMNPLRGSIWNNHSVRTYVGGTKLMPFGSSDNADERFWKYVLTDGLTISSALTKAMSDFNLTGYYAVTGYKDTFGPRPLRVELTWGASPSDLDLHLYLPSGSGTYNHVYYGQMGSLTANPYARLTIDDRNGYGPEGITISEAYTGTYTLKVRNWSGSNIAGTGAVVKIWRGSTLVKSFVVPASGTGSWWNVFTYSGTTGKITSVNTISSADVADELLIPK